jgi:hypothetical protein
VRTHGGDERAACAEALRLEAETYKAAAAHTYTAKMRCVCGTGRATQLHGGHTARGLAWLAGRCWWT